MSFFKSFKRLFVLLFLVFVFSFFPTNVIASGEFSTDYEVNYEVKDSGVTQVTNKITLTNVFSNLYATSYSIILDSISPTNIKVFGEKGPLQFTTVKDSNKTEIKINFSDQVVGKGNSRLFWVVYDEAGFAIRTGEVWEISIPRISENADFKSYNLKLLVPQKFGQEAYISPTPRNRLTQNGLLQYSFSKEDVEKTGIVAGFGEFQVFSFSLNYHLENPLAKVASTEITFPPDTAYQKVYYENINPKPNKMRVDQDGNWIGEFRLNPRERVDVVASGYVQIFSNYRPFLKPSQDSLNQNLLKTTYWDIDNQTIKDLAREYKTPYEIYNFVSNKLKYDYNRVKPNVERLGAVRALDNPESAICMEFTDLFIAISRAAGIPAREINGYAYTENPEIQPLSLVNDVLHAWPEYYDKDKGVWVPVDPTWGSTTGGVDYFSKLDLRHFTFVIHGKDDNKPYAAGSYKLGTNPQKDVYVSFGSLPEKKMADIEISAKLESWIPLISNRLDITFKNSGPSAMYNLSPVIYFDNIKKDTATNIDRLLPYQEYSTYIEIPFSFLGSKTPSEVKIEVNNKEIKVKTNKDQVIVYNLLFIFTVAIIILITILFRLKKISFDKILPRWKFLKKNS